jgi:hypothetical protein
MRRSSLRWLALGVPWLLYATACGKSIGDGCSTNVECSAQGDRQCDLSQPSGYCTVDGCDVTSCPDDGLCVRFFPPQALTVACDPATEEQKHVCDVRETCIAEGYCVEPRLEHRFCMKSCKSNGDCRDGYECRSTGTNGTELLPTMSGVPPKIGKFCTAKPPGSAPPSASNAARSGRACPAG